MKRATLEAIVKANGCTIDVVRKGAGRFRDLEIVGPDAYTLQTLKIALLSHPAPDELNSISISIELVSNPDHPDNGKPFLSVQSVWLD